MSFTSYLAVLADSDVFGLLAIYCLLTAIAGLFERIRSTKKYKYASFIGLMAIPTLHIAGSYLLNLPPA